VKSARDALEKGEGFMSKIGIFLTAGLVLSAVVYQVLGRIPSDALNVALGVMCGIGASIPVSLGLLIALTRRRQAEAEMDWQDQEPSPARYIPQPVSHFREPAPRLEQPQVPQIIVVAPPQGQFAPGQFPQGIPLQATWGSQQPYPFMHEHANAVDAREWRIIGEE
jgi:hypothetical protein